MDIVELHNRAVDQAGVIVAGVTQDQLSHPTPCTEWDVRTLLNHLTGGNWRWAAIAEGKKMERPSAPPDFLGDDPAAGYRQSAEAVKSAWLAPGRLDQSYELPFGTFPGPATVSMHMIEVVTHGWDLAKATGQTPRFDDDIVQAALADAKRSLPEQRPDDFAFASAVKVSEDLPAVDQLAAFMGRRP